MTVHRAKSQISLGIRSVWSESSLCTQWVAEDPSFLCADSEDSDQTRRITRLIWVFVGCTCHFVGFVMRQLVLFVILPVSLGDCCTWLQYCLPGHKSSNQIAEVDMIVKCVFFQKMKFHLRKKRSEEDRKRRWPRPRKSWVRWLSVYRTIFVTYLTEISAWLTGTRKCHLIQGV